MAIAEPKTPTLMLGTAYHLDMAGAWHPSGRVQNHFPKIHSLTSNNCLSLFFNFFHRCKSEPDLVKIHAPATPYQLDHMIAYLERNPHLAMRKFQKPGCSYDPSASWEQLAEELNALWVNGAPKDAKTWKSVSLSANLFI